MLFCAEMFYQACSALIFSTFSIESKVALATSCIDNPIFKRRLAVKRKVILRKKFIKNFITERQDRQILSNSYGKIILKQK